MTPDEWASEYERQKQGQSLQRKLQRRMWRKQLVPGTVPARSADELIAALGFEVKP